MSLRGVVIKEGRIGPNVAGDNREFGLVAGGVAVAGKLDLLKAYTFRRPSDAQAVGLNEAYDEANKVNVYRHIAEFYRRAGEGRKLHVMLVAQTVLPKDMGGAAQRLAVESGGMIADMAFAFNPAAAYTETVVDGMNKDVMEGIAALQAFAGWAEDNDMPLHTVLEGRGLGTTLAALPGLRELPDLEATKVTLVCGQDWDYAEGLGWEMGKKFADVGTFLGVLASQAWNRNPGEVASQNLTDAAQGVWVNGGLSNHKPYAEVFTDLESMNEKGYVFAMRYQGRAGYYWNDGHVCAPVVLDAAGNLNQHTIYYSHTMNEAIRALRAAYLPEVKRPVPLVDGVLPTSMVDYFNAVGNDVFDRLAGRELISAGRTSTDAGSDLLVEKVLRVQFSVVPTGTVGEIVGTINLKSN